DASLRDVCRVKRDVTASPLQSLVMFNSPQFVEASRVLAEQLVRTHGNDDAAIVGELFRTLTSRRATPDELKLLVELHQRQSARFSAAVEKANQLLSIGEVPRDPTLDASQVSATASLAISLLSFDASLTKR
ncbi:MAG: DUF1553 domain-containing protein, partial [Planctomycetaceae bacterium]